MATRRRLPLPEIVTVINYINVKEDIGQQVNLAEKEPKRLRQMMMTFERLKRETGKITNF